MFRGRQFSQRVAQRAAANEPSEPPEQSECLLAYDFAAKVGCYVGCNKDLDCTWRCYEKTLEEFPPGPSCSQQHDTSCYDCMNQCADQADEWIVRNCTRVCPDGFTWGDGSDCDSCLQGGQCLFDACKNTQCAEPCDFPEEAPAPLQYKRGPMQNRRWRGRR